MNYKLKIFSGCSECIEEVFNDWIEEIGQIEIISITQSESRGIYDEPGMDDFN